MPYISQEDRDELEEKLDALIKKILNMFVVGNSYHRGAGTINYVITKILDKTLVHQWDDEVRYHKINTAIGVLECAKLELYRRVAANYEDKAIDINGDVY